MKFPIALAALTLIVAGCNSGDQANSSNTSSTPSTTTTGGGGDTAKPLVAFSQANSSDPWRQVFDADTKAAADKLSDVMSYEMNTAENDEQKQINNIDTFLVKSPKVLLVSPATESVKTATDKAFDAGVAVILLDRSVTGDKWTAWVGGDNVEIGRQAGQYIVEKLGGKGSVLMIQGVADASATVERRKGAMEVFAKNPGIKLIEGDDCKYQRQAAQSYMENFLQSGKPVDAVYAHNDEMAIGAYMAYESASNKPAKKPLFVGVDACQQEIVNMIKEGKIDATFKYPGPGPKGLEIAAEIIKGNPPKDKKIVLPTERVTKENADAYLSSNPNLAK